MGGSVKLTFLSKLQIAIVANHNGQDEAWLIHKEHKGIPPTKEPAQTLLPKSHPTSCVRWPKTKALAPFLATWFRLVLRKAAQHRMQGIDADQHVLLTHCAGGISFEGTPKKEFHAKCGNCTLLFRDLSVQTCETQQQWMGLSGEYGSKIGQPQNGSPASSKKTDHPIPIQMDRLARFPGLLGSNAMASFVIARTT